MGDLTPQSSLSQELEDTLECGVCLSVMIRPCSTSCGHSFCRRCLRTALAMDTQRRCPICRHDLRQADLVVNRTLWTIIQRLYPDRCAEAPESPANPPAAAPPRPAPGPSRLGLAPDTGTTRTPFIPPRRIAPSGPFPVSSDARRPFRPPRPAQTTLSNADTFTAALDTIITTSSSSDNRVNLDDLIGFRRRHFIPPRPAQQQHSQAATTATNSGTGSRVNSSSNSSSDGASSGGDGMAEITGALQELRVEEVVLPTIVRASILLRNEGEVIDLTREEEEEGPENEGSSGSGAASSRPGSGARSSDERAPLRPRQVGSVQFYGPAAAPKRDNRPASAGW